MLYFLALKINNRFILNGGQVLTTYRKVIEIGSSVLEYSGVDSILEVVNGSRPLEHPLTLMFLAVSRLPPPDITYTYTRPLQRQAPPVNLRLRWGRKIQVCETKCGGK